MNVRIRCLPQLPVNLTWRQYAHGLCYLLIIVGAWYRIDYIVHFNPIYDIWSDPGRHWKQGIDALGSDPLSMTDPILFQLYIGALAKLTLKIPALVAFYTCLLALIGPWVWYLFLRELQPSKLLALAGWATLSILPSWISIYGYFMQETLMLPMLGLALYLTWRCKRQASLSSFLLMIFVWTLTGLTRGVCIPMAAVATVWLWVIQGNKIARMLSGALLLGLILGPLAHRGFEKMNIFAPHGIGHLNMIYAKSGKKAIDIRFKRNGAHWRYTFQSPAMITPPLEPISDWRTKRKGKVFARIDVDQGFGDWSKSLNETALDIDKYLWITRENLIFLFFAPSWPDSNRARFIGNANYQLRWIWLPLSVVCLIWTLSQWRRTDLLLPAIILAWFVVQGLLPISINEGRYRKPLTGLLIAQVILLTSTRRPRWSTKSRRDQRPYPKTRPSKVPLT